MFKRLSYLVTSIGENTFFSCKSLKYFRDSGNIAQWNKITLAKGLTEV